MDGGIPPLKLLWDKVRYLIITREVKLFGIFPDSVLKDKLMFHSFKQLDMFSGISPVNELLAGDSCCNRDKRPNSGGLFP